MRRATLFLVRCSICSSDERAEIEAAVAVEGDLGAIAVRFSLSTRALERHVALHPRCAAAPNAGETLRAARPRAPSSANDTEPPPTVRSARLPPRRQVHLVDDQVQAIKDVRDSLLAMVLPRLREQRAMLDTTIAALEREAVA